MRSLIVIALAAFAATARAEPVFRNAAADLGPGFAASNLRFLPDSKLKDTYYVLPAGLSQPKLFPLDLGGGSITRSRTDDGFIRYSMTLQPDVDMLSLLGLVEGIGQAAEKTPDFTLLPVDCGEADVRLNGIPAHLVARVRITSPDFQLMLPGGYAYGVDLDTKEPAALQAALMHLGVHGSAILRCSGYPAGANTALDPVVIEQAIPVNAQFQSIEDAL
jgi:hypothetical protein